MNQELKDRLDNTYFDKSGTQILEGDLLKIYHFGKGNRTQYMYHVAVMEDTGNYKVLAMRCYTKDKPHYRLYVVCNNEKRVYQEAKIINKYDWQTTRLKIKL